MNDPLAPSPPLSLISYKKVPNVFPPSSPIPDSYRLAIIGEAPGEREEQYETPFIGPSGDLLNSLLASAGIDRTRIFVGNVCPYRPPGNEISEWGYEHEKVKEGWAELQQQLKDYAPHCILALGNTPLHFLAGRVGIGSWRGSILSTPFGKVVPALHPAAVLRDYPSWPLLRFDIGRACEEAKTPSLVLPQRTLELDLSAHEICNRLDNWPAGRLLSFDIEGGLDAFPCCSCADSAYVGFIIAWSRHSTDEQARIACSLSRVLYRTDVPKVLQNSLYDRFVLAYAYSMLIRNVVEDTMVKQWEIYPELPKGLGTITSIWTREPHYKWMGKAGNKNEANLSDHASANQYYSYCVLDSCITLEACEAMRDSLLPDAARHYSFNMDLLSPLLYMELRGICYDSATAADELAKVKAGLSSCAARLTFRAGHSITGAKGSISSVQLKNTLYREMGFPEQKKGRGPTAKVTTDVEALLNLQKKFPNDTFLGDLLLHRKLEGLQETLTVSTDPDGRVRCGYNLVGTETGRLTCYTSPTGSGANLQTITKKLRKLYRADPGYWLFQCDLAGADGWTVAAHCLKHGDPTMWDDYRFGLKPAKIIALLYAKGTVPIDREELKTACRDVDGDSWLYFACKRIQHGSNYGMQEKTMAMQILKDSYNVSGKPVFLAPTLCAALQRLYLSRYPGIYSWHQWARREVSEGRNLQSASGHTRVFFGRRKGWDQHRKCWDADHDTWKEFLADEPQENTTYATNVALHKLWHDPENRLALWKEGHVPEYDPEFPRVTGRNPTSLMVQPLHTVHDALIGQFPKDRAEWATSKIREWFNNTLSIAGTGVVIPFEGAYGPSWGELGTKYGGGEI